MDQTKSRIRSLAIWAGAVLIAVGLAYAYHPGLRRARAVRNLDIDFYGQVLTLDGQPVPDLDVTVRVKDVNFIQHVLMLGWGVKYISQQVVTDQNGRFSVEDRKGVGIQVRVLNTPTLIFNPGRDDIPASYDFGFNKVSVEHGQVPLPDSDDPEVIVGVPREIYEPSQPYDRHSWNKLIGEAGARRASEFFRTLPEGVSED